MGMLTEPASCSNQGQGLSLSYRLSVVDSVRGSSDPWHGNLNVLPAPLTQIFTPPLRKSQRAASLSLACAAN